MAKTIILRMTDPLYMRVYMGFIPFGLLAAYGILLLWKGFSGDTSTLVPRWMYFIGGLICILPLPAYGMFLRHQGLL